MSETLELRYGRISFAAFGWIWAEFIVPYTAQFILLLLSAVIPSRNPCPLAAICAHAKVLPPPHLKDNVVCFRSWAVSLLLHNILPHSFRHMSILVSSVPIFFSWTVQALFDLVWQSNLAFLFLSVTCGLHLGVNPLSCKHSRGAYLPESVLDVLSCVS